MKSTLEHKETGKKSTELSRLLHQDKKPRAGTIRKWIDQLNTLDLRKSYSHKIKKNLEAGLAKLNLIK